MGKNKDEGIIEKTKDNGLVINTGNVMSVKEIMKTFRCLSVIGITLSISMMILALIVGGILTYTCMSFNKTQIIENKNVVAHLTIINDSSESEIIDTINGYTDMKGFTFSYVVVPTLVIFSGMIAVLIISASIHKFVRDVETEDELFTKEKLKKLRRIRTYLMVIGLFVIVFFSLMHILIYALFEAIFEFVLYMFNKCVKTN